MKKGIKITLIILGVLLVAGLCVCLVVFPTQSKEYYERFKELMTQPIPIIGVSAVVLVSGALAIISRTTVGKSYLTKLKTKCDELNDDYTAKLQEVKEKATEISVLLEEYKAKAEYYEGIILEVCDTIPNKKVNEIAQKIRDYDLNAKEEAEKAVFDKMVENIKTRINDAYNGFIEGLTDEEKIEIADKYLEVVKQYKELMEQVEGLTIDNISQFAYEEVIALWQKKNEN